MLRSADELIGYRISATDSEIGKAADFLFDDNEWRIRHLVVDTGKWLSGRKVLLSPQSVSEPDWKRGAIPVSLSSEKIKNSPSIDADRPVSRQQELELFRYYAWTPYWDPGMLGPVPEPSGISVPNKPGRVTENDDPHLRSVKSVQGYHVLADDGEIGHISDFVVEDENWIIRYAIVDTRNWLPGRKVLVSPWWFKEINWPRRKAMTDFKREDIRNSPEYNPEYPVNREYEELLYDYYGRPAYWSR